MVGEGVGSWEGDDEDFEAMWAEWVAALVDTRNGSRRAGG